MTSAQFLLESRVAVNVVVTVTRRLRCAALPVLLLLVQWSAGSGCVFQPTLKPVSGLDAPYGNHQLWAVAPLRNESGVTSADPLLAADLLTQEAQQVGGVDTIPVNRVLDAMDSLEMYRIETVGDARTLMNVLGVDGLIVGTITAYDPYPPMTLGVAVELYHRDRPGDSDLDPVALTTAPSGDASTAAMAVRSAASQAAGVYRADNHDVLRQLEAYSSGRSVPDSAYGDEIYLVSMELYTRFVSHQLLRDLIHQERERMQLMQMTMTPTHRR